MEQKIKNQLSGFGFPPEARSLGWCHMYWGIKKEILKNDYNIEWKSPAELNPNIMYD